MQRAGLALACDSFINCLRFSHSCKPGAHFATEVVAVSAIMACLSSAFWRMHLAREGLADSNISVSALALDLGYRQRPLAVWLSVVPWGSRPPWSRKGTLVRARFPVCILYRNPGIALSLRTHVADARKRDVRRADQSPGALEGA